MADSDPTTQSNYKQIFTKNIELEWVLDFDRKVISGSATHTLEVKDPSTNEVIFDTADLDIDHAEINGQTVEHSLGKQHEVMGVALHILLPSGLRANDTISVKILYKTTEKSTALQWLEKEQTQGKKFPYLFSQCQPIYARTLVPIQDTPSVKVTYSARVSSVLPVLLSAIRISPPSDGPAHDGKEIGKDSVTYTYEQPVPIPSYLIAIAAGNVVYRGFSTPDGKQWKCGVWAEPESIDDAYYEFSEDTVKFMIAEEKLVIPYRFGVYDLLVLPPSFPYGGMENACLSFLTPTLLTGDRSLVDVVVHELTHSWFGNGVTHANASHFWLNEGWTTYIERILQQDLNTPAHRDFSFIIGYRALKDALKLYEDKPKYQRLVIPFEKGEDPDEAYSSIPYEKGANFLYYLEKQLGGLDVFLPYVKEYVSTYIGKSITTEQWKDHLYNYYRTHDGQEQVDALDKVDWKAWLHGEGLTLPIEPIFDTSLATSAYELAARWDASRASEVSSLPFKDTDLRDFNANQIIVFLERLPTYKPLPHTHIEYLGQLYKVDTTSNAEIRQRFWDLALREPSSLAAKHYSGKAVDWVVGRDGTGVIKGRMKFCRTTFRAVYKVNKELAWERFLEAKDSFHPIAKKLIEKDLGLV
ncbi:hypothetical protein BDN72DRAFT_793498 [Pluteus cervinus]|uniref:Uncharacterized protein n=1 Tax=Pluteus cervinus TaxID=181527 RepID=A0ACD3B0F6_9AGAR|nr:hypothetical protein BDN72DRAFT_793498 [Pluteus cervinus]